MNKRFYVLDNKSFSYAPMDDDRPCFYYTRKSTN